MSDIDTELGARIDALDDSGRKSVLHYLAGYAPAAVEIALDEIGRQAAGAGIIVTGRLEDGHG